MVILQRKLYFSKDPEGVQHFPGGRSFFFQGGGPTFLLNPIETHIVCDFPGGGGVADPLSPFGSAHVEIEKCTGVNLKVNFQGLKYIKI